MIKNIIFDMGGVLIEWRPDKLVARLGYAGADAKLLLREIFGDAEWVGLDPVECFFLDDSSANVDAAIVLGLQAAVFDGDMKRLRRAMRKAGIPVKDE